MSDKKKIMAIVGTRPDAVKMCPLINELKKREDFSVVVCATGQHRELLSGVLDIFGVTPDYDLQIMQTEQDLFDITSRVMWGVKETLEAERPDAILVHGDTTSAFGAALAAFYKKIPICHVEAGLRTYDIKAPFPEEYNRRAIGLMAAYHFAPTESAEKNLISEGVDEFSVSVTGNTVIDALSKTVKTGYSHPDLEWAKGSRLILLTVHRRESRGTAMRAIFSAVRKILEEYPDVKALYPIHPTPLISELAGEILGDCQRLRICKPLEVTDFHNFLSECYLALTDSGGIQEEAAALGKPALVVRNTTEREDGLMSGGIRLVGTTEGSVYRGIRELLENRALYYAMSHAKNPYGAGNASRNIADIMKRII